jgi:hypothetical protein
MTTSARRSGARIKGVSRLDDFGVVDDTCVRYRGYTVAASKLDPRLRAAWWRDVFRRDPDMLEFINGDEKR